MKVDPTQAAFAASVARYAAEEDLQPAEAHAFARYIRPGDAILDLGVGAGRTTAHLAPLAGDYLGIDYAEPMVEVCRARFPGLRFEVADASDLRFLESGSFDVAIFSFNGLGCLPDDGSRRKCLIEVARVLRPGGTFIFSINNSRGFIVPPIFTRNPIRNAWRIAFAAWQSALVCGRLILAGLPKAGYISHPVDGGIKLWIATPKIVRRELRKVGLMTRETIGFEHPRKLPPAMTRWFYFVAQK